MDVAALVISLFATGAAAAAAVYARGQRVEARRANAIAHDLASRYIPGWRAELGPVPTDGGGNMVILINESPETAYNVEISLAPAYIVWGESHHEVVTPHSSVVLGFDTDQSFAADDALRVTWSRQNGANTERQTWFVPLIWVLSGRA